MKISRTRANRLLQAMGAKRPEDWQEDRIISRLCILTELEEVPDLEKREQKLLLKIVEAIDNDEMIEIEEEEAAEPDEVVKTAVENIEPEAEPEQEETAEQTAPEPEENEDINPTNDPRIRVESEKQTSTKTLKAEDFPQQVIACPDEAEIYFQKAAQFLYLGMTAIMCRAVGVTRNNTEIRINPLEVTRPSEKKSEKPAKKEKSSKAGKDRFGSRLGSRGAKINEQLSSTPQTMAELCVCAGFDSKSNFGGHLKKLVDAGLVVKEDKEYFLPEE
uniref:Uncharacterized protein n=2 Tax=viral metagenome TaxID=1070528 RepID=A0A6M3IQ97_9ZZZZ